MADEQALQKAKKKSEEPKEEKVSAEEMLQLQIGGLKSENLRLQMENLQLRAGLLKQQETAMQRAIQEKYKLSDNDQVDPLTLKIIRA